MLREYIKHHHHRMSRSHQTTLIQKKQASTWSEQHLQRTDAVVIKRSQQQCLMVEVYISPLIETHRPVRQPLCLAKKKQTTFPYNSQPFQSTIYLRCEHVCLFEGSEYSCFHRTCKSQFLCILNKKHEFTTFQYN